MKPIFTFSSVIFWATVLLLPPELNAQEPVAPNGKFVTVEGLKLYYEESGQGMPLILLHGFGRTGSDWAIDVPELAKEYRVISIDLPGHGRSDYMDTTEIYLHKRAAEYILGLLASLKIDSAYVMGVSSGAFVALYLATLKPELTKKVITIAGQVYYSGSTRKAITALGGHNNMVMQPEMLTRMHGKEKGNLIARQFWNFRKLYGDPVFTPDVLSTVKAKTLIIHGDNDPVAPVSNAWELYQNIPGAHLWIVPNGGHVPMIIPGNHADFQRRVLEFFRGDWDRK